MAHELDERMRAVEGGQIRLETTITDNIHVTSRLLTKYGDTLYGTDSTPGLTVRLDREETKSKNISRVVWLVVAGAVTMGMTFAATAIF